MRVVGLALLGTRVETRFAVPTEAMEDDGAVDEGTEEGASGEGELAFVWIRVDGWF